MGKPPSVARTTAALSVSGVARAVGRSIFTSANRSAFVPASHSRVLPGFDAAYDRRMRYSSADQMPRKS